MQNALGKYSQNDYLFIVEIQKHLKIWSNKFWNWKKSIVCQLVFRGGAMICL